MLKPLYLAERYLPYFWHSAIAAAFVGLVFAAPSLRLTPKTLAQSAPDRIMSELNAGAPTERGLPNLLQIDQKPLAFSTDCTIAACIALTFDDGPDAVTTPRVLASLEKAHARATFFVIGNKIAGHERILQRIQADGSEIGNHSWSHPYFTKIKPEDMLDQINKTQSALVAAGVPPARLFRPPYGAMNDQVRQTVPLPLAFWNVDPRDWSHKNPNELIADVEAHARPGAIIVMHDTLDSTTHGLDELINRLQYQYQLVTLSELVQIPSDANGQTIIH